MRMSSPAATFPAAVAMRNRCPSVGGSSTMRTRENRAPTAVLARTLTFHGWSGSGCGSTPRMNSWNLPRPVGGVPAAGLKTERRVLEVGEQVSDLLEGDQGGHGHSLGAKW
jgi:hypothetical protein